MDDGWTLGAKIMLCILLAFLIWRTQVNSNAIVALVLQQGWQWKGYYLVSPS